MNELLSDKLWPTIKRLAKTSTAKRAAVAYVTSEDIVKFRGGDLLITDASNLAIAAGETSAQLLSRLLKRGVELYSLPGLHTKVMILGGSAIIGSANISESSTNRLVEAAWVTDTPAAIGMAISLIDQLQMKSERIDRDFIKRILKIKVKRRPQASGNPAKASRVKLPKHRTWIIGVHELAREYPAEMDAIEAGESIAEEKVSKESSEVSWIRWSGNSRFRSVARTGDAVIQIWTANRSKNPSAVYRHAPILHRQDEESCTRFFVEEFTDCEETTMSWSQFKKLLRRVGVDRTIKPGSIREIEEATSSALFALWGQ